MTFMSRTTVDDELSGVIASLPAERLGSLLLDRRRQANVERRVAADAAVIDVSTLADIESGRRSPEVGMLAGLLHCYGMPLDDMVPGRHPMPTVGAGASADEIVRGYVDAVRASRKAGQGTKLNFRRDELIALGQRLGTDPVEIERQLISVSGCSRKEAKVLRRYLVAAMVMIPLASGLFGGELATAAAAAPAHATSITQLATVHTPRSHIVRSHKAATATETVVGVLEPSTLRAVTTHAAGIGEVVVAVHWSSFAPTQGTVDEQYVSQIDRQIQDYTAAGMRVILSPGLANPPAWVFDLNSSTRFVDQYGTVWQGGPGEDVPDAVFDPAVRQAQQAYLLQLGQALQGEPIHAVRSGGLLDGELRYPSAGAHNSYWAFSADAQAQSPIPGWRPGDPGSTQASTFINWYLGSITDYQNALVTTTAQAFPAATVMALYPGWGVRPGQIAQAVAGNLNGESPAELNGSLQQGQDWASQVASLPAGTTVYTTDLAAPDQGTGTTGEAPIYYLASLAAPRGLALAGENAGAQTQTALSNCVQRAHDLGLTDMLWMDEADLYDPAAGAPTLAELGADANYLDGRSKSTTTISALAARR